MKEALRQRGTADGELRVQSPIVQASVGWKLHVPFDRSCFPVPPKQRTFLRRKRPSISHHSNVNEIVGKFGGADKLRNAVNQLQSLLYAA